MMFVKSSDNIEMRKRINYPRKSIVIDDEFYMSFRDMSGLTVHLGTKKFKTFLGKRDYDVIV